ncbi:MAG: FAD-dependent thymidylate synthase [Prevotella sp.]
MKINRPFFEIWLQEPGINGIYRQVERAGRICYKSEDHASEDSARPFAERMIKSHHTAMLEHATVYLKKKVDTRGEAASCFSKVNIVDGIAYITTNLRVLVENGWMDDLNYICEPTDHHEKRVTVHFTTQISITREFNRHRVNSMAEQSTRYCNYSKDKFGSEVTINLPKWVHDLPDGDWSSDVEKGSVDIDGNSFLELARKVVDGEADDMENWLFANLAAERSYMNLISSGHIAQEARAILPLDTNTELVHTAFVSDWLHFFDLRALGTTGAPHPDAKVLALPLMEEFQKLGLIPEN